MITLFNYWKRHFKIQPFNHLATRSYTKLGFMQLRKETQVRLQYLLTLFLFWLEFCSFWPGVCSFTDSQSQMHAFHKILFRCYDGWFTMFDSWVTLMMYRAGRQDVARGTDGNCATAEFQASPGAAWFPVRHPVYINVAWWQNLIPSFPQIAPGWRAWA